VSITFYGNQLLYLNEFIIAFVKYEYANPKREKNLLCKIIFLRH
jgi:hypothetical protein